VTPSAKRQAIAILHEAQGLPVGHPCQVLRLSPAAYYRPPMDGTQRSPRRDHPVIDALQAKISEDARWGSGSVSARSASTGMPGITSASIASTAPQVVVVRGRGVDGSSTGSRLTNLCSTRTTLAFLRHDLVVATGHGHDTGQCVSARVQRSCMRSWGGLVTQGLRRAAATRIPRRRAYAAVQPYVLPSDEKW